MFVSFEKLLQEGLSEPECYGDLVYKFRKIVGKTVQFKKELSKRYKQIGYNIDDCMHGY